MIYSYEECIKLIGSYYLMNKEIEAGNLFKVCPGIYSTDKYTSQLAIINKKFPNAVFTMQSAFYYQGLTDTIPTHYYLLTDKDATKIKDDNIKQLFDNCHSIEMGCEVINHNGEKIRVYNKERLLVELIRYKSKLPFDYYKEIISNYRKIVDEIRVYLIEEYASKLPKKELVMNTIQMEVF